MLGAHLKRTSPRNRAPQRSARRGVPVVLLLSAFLCAGGCGSDPETASVPEPVETAETAGTSETGSTTDDGDPSPIDVDAILRPVVLSPRAGLVPAILDPARAGAALLMPLGDDPVAAVEPVARDASLRPTLPWRFEVSVLSGWRPGPSGIVMDSAGVVWRYDHADRPWIANAGPTAELVTVGELEERFAGAVPVHRADAALLERALGLAAVVDELPLVTVPVSTFDVAPSFVFWEPVPGDGSTGASWMREVTVATTAEVRDGEAARLLCTWAALQLGDAALGRFPPARVDRGILAELQDAIDALLPPGGGKRASSER